MENAYQRRDNFKKEETALLLLQIKLEIAARNGKTCCVAIDSLSFNVPKEKRLHGEEVNPKWLAE